MTAIDAVDAWEVLDSRGDPTVRVRVDAGKSSGTFTVPSGASTGAYEAHERRDGGDRFGGAGVSTAVEAAAGELADAVVGMDVGAQASIDTTLVEVDGTDDLSRLGGNAVLGVSGAVAHAGAAAADLPLYRHLAPDGPGALPLPMVNLLSGGLHAEGGMAVQDVLAIPVGSQSYRDALETVHTVRSALRDRLIEDGHRPLVSDEGGFSPPLPNTQAAFALAVDAIHAAGHDASRTDVGLAVDVAATHLEADGTYRVGGAGGSLGTDEMVEQVLGWLREFPIVSVEDPLAEDDWAGWRHLSDRAGDQVQLLGDDLLATNPDRLDRAIEIGAANAALVKLNQAGTVSRTIEVTRRAQAAGWATVVSARSGETCDTTIADLAVALDAGQIKIGSLARSERLAKYNRLLEIERTHDGGYAGDEPLAFTRSDPRR